MRSIAGGTSFLVLVGLVLLAGLTGCLGDDDPVAPAVPTTGTLALQIDGLPDGLALTIEVRGPSSYAASVHGDTTLSGLEPGPYSITAPRPVDGYVEFVPTISNTTPTVESGSTTDVGVLYAQQITRGHLAVAIDGLPQDVAGEVLVTGPSNFRRTLTTATMLESLVPGTYTLSATAVTDGSIAYFPLTELQSTTVAAGATTDGGVVYEARDLGDLDLRVLGVELVQSVQTASSDVPLVRSRDALLRVYADTGADAPLTPDLRVEIRVNGDLVDTVDLTPTDPAQLRGTNRTDLGASVNWILPAQYVQPGLGLRVTIDSSNDVPELDESNNTYPAGSGGVVFAVASIDPLSLTLVPVHQSVNGLVGDVNVSNSDTYTTMAEAMYPFPYVDTKVRATYTTDAPALQADDGNGAWGTVLQEVQALRSLDATEDYYFGVVRTNYTAGVAGLGYVPSSRSSGYRSAIGWDRASTRAPVMAHELGHNLGRQHAPCGGPASPDPQYPYPEGSIGQWGYDARIAQLIDPSNAKDIMSYCTPQWISDHNFEQILAFMGGVVSPVVVAPFSVTHTMAEPQPCLMVWGRVRDGEIVLDPAMVVTARPNVPRVGGEYDVVARDANGNEVVRVSFDAPRIGCSDDDTSAFSWFLPIDPDRAVDLQSIEMRGRGQVARQDARTASLAHARRIPLVLERTGAGRARLEWDAGSLPMALVRDAVDGTVLAIGRHGALDFACEASELDVVLSDGVRTLDWSRRLD